MDSAPSRVSAGSAEALPLPVGRLSKQVLNTSSLEVRWYRPPNPDPQASHDRDEVYVVVSGQCEFMRASTRVSFIAGDLLFAARGEEHRFENHTPDTAVWAVFGHGAGRRAATARAGPRW